MELYRTLFTVIDAHNKYTGFSQQIQQQLMDPFLLIGRSIESRKFISVGLFVGIKK